MGLFRQDATGGFSKGLYEATRERVPEVETVTAEVVMCPSCGVYAEIVLDERGKVGPCPDCGASRRTIVKGVELDRINWW